MTLRKGEAKIDIRCKDPKTKSEFKKIAADFDNYEEVIKWFIANYPLFCKLAPSSKPVRGGVL
jgi:hypothetical protein